MQMPGSRRNAHWFIVQCILRVVFTVWFRYRARGVEKIPPEGGGLFLINHLSFLDPLLVGLPLKRPVSFLGRDSLFKVPVVGHILRNTYVMPINRDAASSTSIRTAVDRMRDGFLVGIFPEGTRNEAGDVGEFKPGFISLVRRGKTPVYPVGIAGAHLAMPRNAVVPRPKKLRVVFGDRLPPDQVAALSKKGREEELIQLARDRVVECQHEAEAWRR